MLGSPGQTLWVWGLPAGDPLRSALWNNTWEGWGTQDWAEWGWAVMQFQEERQLTLQWLLKQMTLQTYPCYLSWTSHCMYPRKGNNSVRAVSFVMQYLEKDSAGVVNKQHFQQLEECFNPHRVSGWEGTHVACKTVYSDYLLLPPLWPQLVPFFPLFTLSPCQ